MGVVSRMRREMSNLWTRKPVHISKLIGVVLISLWLLVSLRGSSVQALPKCPQARALPELSRNPYLSFDLSRLESRVDQLEAQLSQPRNGASSARPAPAPRLGQPVPSKDPMFDRLATMVIELKEQVSQVEARVSKLESQKLPRTAP